MTSVIVCAGVALRARVVRSTEKAAVGRRNVVASGHDREECKAQVHEPSRHGATLSRNVKPPKDGGANRRVVYHRIDGD